MSNTPMIAVLLIRMFMPTCFVTRAAARAEPSAIAISPSAKITMLVLLIFSLSPCRSKIDELRLARAFLNLRVMSFFWHVRFSECSFSTKKPNREVSEELPTIRAKPFARQSRYKQLAHVTDRKDNLKFHL